MRFLCRHLVQNLTPLDFLFLTIETLVYSAKAHWGLSPVEVVGHGQDCYCSVKAPMMKTSLQAATISLLPSFLSSETSALSPVSV